MTNNIKKEDSQIIIKIRNFVLSRYIDCIVNDKELRSNLRTNILITAYFRKNLSYLLFDNPKEKEQFFYRFKNKYQDEFKKSKKLYSDILARNRRLLKTNDFKLNYSSVEWEKINGNRLIDYTALSKKDTKNSGYSHLKNIVRIIDKK